MNEYLISPLRLRRQKEEEDKDLLILNIMIFNQIQLINSLSEIIERNSICTKRKKFRLKISSTFIHDVKRNNRFHIVRCYFVSHQSFLANMQVQCSISLRLLIR